MMMSVVHSVACGMDITCGTASVIQQAHCSRLTLHMSSISSHVRDINTPFRILGFTVLQLIVGHAPRLSALVCVQLNYVV